MSIDRSNEAQRILEEQRAKRPRWYRLASKVTPSWFSGGELDLLKQHERNELFVSLATGNRPAWPVLLILAAVNVPNITRHVHSARALDLRCRRLRHPRAGGIADSSPNHSRDGA